jgi:spermidine synthase
MALRDDTRADLAGFAVGLGSLWVQVVLVRRLLAALAGNELTIGLAFAGWMVWTGLGSWLLARRSASVRSPGNALALCLAAVSALIVPSVLATARIKSWIGVGPGELAGLPEQLLAAAAVTAPSGALLGWSFSLAARLQRDADTAVGRAYRYEALGAAAAGTLLSIWLSGRADPVLPGAAAAAVLAALALVLHRRREAGGRVARAAAGAATAAALLMIVDLGLGLRPLHQAYQKLYWSGRDVVESFDSRYGYLAMVRTGTELTLFADGAPLTTFPDPARDEVLIHLPLAMSLGRERVLIIGGGLKGVAEAAAAHGVETLDHLQLDPGALALERRWVGPGGIATGAREPGEVRDGVGDGRAWLRERPGELPYDAIIVNLPDPFIAAQDRFFTVEFMREAAAALAPGGVLAFTAGSTPPNLAYRPGELELLAGAVRTAQTVFPRVELLPLTMNLIVAGDERARLTTDAREIGSRLAGAGVTSYYASAGMIGPDLDPDLLAELQAKVQAADIEINTDLHPRGFLAGIRLWAEAVSPGAQRALAAAAGLPPWAVLAVPLAVLVLGAGLRLHERESAEPMLAAAVSGFTAMVIEVALLIAYQMLEGSVYFALALLSACFMAGLAVGTRVWERARARRGLLAFELFLMVWAAVEIIAVRRLFRAEVHGFAALALFGLLLLGQGAAAGGLFAAAARRMTGGAAGIGRGTGRVYGIELVASALGATLASGILLPVFGCLMALGAALLAAIALAGWSAAMGRRGANRG